MSSEMTRIDTKIKLEEDKFNGGEFFGVMVEALGLLVLILATREPAALLQFYVATGRMFYLVQRPVANVLGQTLTVVRAFLPF